MSRRKASRAKDHPTTAYAKVVVAGQILTGGLVRLACKRHLDDLKNGWRRGIKFDEQAANHAMAFFPGFLHLDGDINKSFVLTPVEEFIVGSVFGWMTRKNVRRFRTAYLEMGKGSGKTPLAAGVGLYGLTADEEWAAEIYAAAVTRDQASILFKDAYNMANAAVDELKSRLEIFEHNLAFPETLSFFRPVSSEGRSLDGKRVHMALIDEIHEHRTPIVVEKMDLSKKGRTQPLAFEITNAGYNRESICWTHHEYSRAVLEGRIQNDSWFAYVCGLDPCDNCKRSGRLAPSDDCRKCDDWRDESVWIKTNPNVGVTPQLDYLRKVVHEARGMPSKQNIVKRLNFCIWTEQETRWLDLELWDAGAASIQPEQLLGRPCVIGLDLSSNRDLTAAAKLFLPTDAVPYWDLVVRLWIPSENVAGRVIKDGVPYDQWISEGWIETTPGNVVDKDFIEAAILEDATVFKIVEVAYDRLFADQLVQHLENESPGYVTEKRDAKGEPVKQWCVPVGMGFYSMAAPCKEFERLVQAKILRHGGNPVLRWMAGNVQVKLDPAGNMKPDKQKSTERIDGIVATLLALARAVAQPDGTKPPTSIYEEREPRAL